MKTEMIMPQMGESIAEATILKWIKSVGDSVEKDETILEISTDKVDSEIPAPATGTIVEIKAQEGDTVPVKAVIAVIDSEASAGDVQATASSSAAPETSTNGVHAAPSADAKAEENKDGVTKKVSQGLESEVKKQENDGVTLEQVGGAKSRQAAAPAPQAAVQIEASASAIPGRLGSRVYSPVVRSIAAQSGLTPNELATVSGTGENGRVTKEDLLTYLQHRDPSAQAAPVAAKSAKPALPKSDIPRPEYGADGTKVEVMDRMRKIIAEHMVKSKATSPHVYTVAEVDVTNLAKWRKIKQEKFVSREGFKLSFTPFFLEAAVKALIEFPQVNASVDGDKIIYKKDINIGCAVALGTTGLIVPVIKKADQLSLAGIASSLQDIASRARNKKLDPTDIQGGTFTVTNPGTFGSVIGYPIINQPQLGILGVGAIKKRPMVIKDAIAIRDIVYITLSYDHRVIDGSLGGSFLNYLSKYLENWDMNREVY